MEEARRKAKAVVVGGSIAGISCTHALIAAGWDVVVLEKTPSPPTSSATGAGLGIDPLSQKLIQSWLNQPQALELHTLPLTIDHAENESGTAERRVKSEDTAHSHFFHQENSLTPESGEQATEWDKKITWTLTRDENFNFRAAHWADLHSLLYNALPQGVVLWGHLFLSFCVSDEKSVKVSAKVLQSGDTIDVEGDLLVAADGCLSSIRKTLLPDVKLRYSGYCAWRGVLDFSENQNSETILQLKKAFPELGKCNYFILGVGTHSILYELFNKRMNWIWYVNQPEPDLEGNSVTTKVSRDMIEEMYEAAEKVWVPEFVKLMLETKEPFLNAIYDSEPLERVVWDNVVLIGDAAHPVSPHGARSTNMSILDAAVLGKCLEKWGLENLNLSLKEYQSIRLPVNAEQVLFSRRMGRIKQGLVLPDREPFDPRTASEEDCVKLQLRNIPFFSEIPSVLMQPCIM